MTPRPTSTRIAAFLFALLAAVPLLSAEPYKEKAGPFSVSTSLYDWTDATRDRSVPVKIYFPSTGKGPFPVIVFSHGLGGSREGYEYLGHHWASHGYVSVHVQHLGSDDAVWRGSANPEQAMARSAADLRNAIARPLDVRFVLDQLEKLQGADSALKGRLDLQSVGMAGHSFGAWTTLAAAGQRFGPRQTTFSDSRIKAALAMSAPVPKMELGLDEAFGGIHIPVFHMTGTLDDSPIGDTKASERRIAFDHIRGVDQYLVTFEGGDHMIFSGRPRQSGGGKKDDLFQNLILQSSTAFWDAYLKQDAQAKKWLGQGDFAHVLGKNGKLEERR